MGVLTDIGSHLLDICLYWFGGKINFLKILELNRFENRAPDHSIISLEINKIKIELEMTLCMWRNTFSCDVIGFRGSGHLNSLCKWGQNTFNYRKRKFPSGQPYEKTIVINKGDPTWKAEHLFFKKLIKTNTKTDLKKDLILNSCFLQFSKSLR